MQINRSSAFTMMEILMVLFIIGFLFAFLGPRFFKMIGKKDVAVTKLKISKIKNSLIEYKQDMGHYPNTREGKLEALRARPNVKGNEKWDGPYLDEDSDLLDEWGNDFEYNLPPIKYRDKYKYFEIISSGGPEEDAKELYSGA